MFPATKLFKYVESLNLHNIPYQLCWRNIHFVEIFKEVTYFVTRNILGQESF